MTLCVSINFTQRRKEAATPQRIKLPSSLRLGGLFAPLRET